MFLLLTIKIFSISEIKDQKKRCESMEKYLFKYKCKNTETRNCPIAFINDFEQIFIQRVATV